jgi:mRNA interferase RelE/StbE
MNASGGAATQIYAPTFDRRFFSLPPGVQEQIQSRLDALGRHLRDFPHVRLQGVEAFRLRVGDYRVIYQFNVEKNTLVLITVAHRREVYKTPLN